MLRRLIPLLLVLPGLAPADLEQPPPSLTVGETRYLGATGNDGTVEAFLGVPFAAPPVGALRWRAPEAAATPGGDRSALTPAPACLQGGYISEWYRGVVRGFGGDPGVVPEPPESEDCLYLNAWRPVDRSEGPLPILVYVHGGSNTGGWSWEPNYQGESLAKRGLVVVTIAYRLGVFGYFSHPELDRANFGLLDQLQAIRWVRDNAAALGGDPTRVTVMGESSGGNNLIHLLAAPEGAGLFQRLIVQSAGWALRNHDTIAVRAPLGLELQQALLGDGASLDGLRGLSAKRVFEAAETVYATHAFDPVIDGDTMVEPVVATLERGATPDVDLLIGSNADEWKMYLDPDAGLDDWTENDLPPATREPVLARLPEDVPPRRALDRAVTAWVMVCPSLHLADRVAAMGGRSWVYWFSRQREGDQAAAMGAYHGAELPYIFDTHDPWLPTNALDRALTESVMTYWSRFIRTGDPNAPGEAAWPPWTVSGAPTQELGRQIGPLPHPEAALCGPLGVSPPDPATRTTTDP